MRIDKLPFGLSFFKQSTSIALCLFFLFLVLPSESAYARLFKKSAVVMGTEFEVTLHAPDKTKADLAFAAALGEMVRVEGEMSEWREGTAVSSINKNAGKAPVRVSAELYKVISAAQTVSALSGGAFDITWASMRGLWSFAEGRERLPSAKEVAGRLPLVDYKEVMLDDEKKSVFVRKEGAMIGLGAIAKGYGVDMAMKRIMELGIKDALVRAGGDMRVQGTDNGNPWTIGIRHPRDKKKHLARLGLTNISISTSGDYERFFIKDGVLYHHIMDPKTGYPAAKSQSVTVLAPDTMTSDALSTALFVMGPSEGLALVGRLKGVEAVIVDAEGRVHTSAGITLSRK